MDDTDYAILLVEDEENDVMLVQVAFQQNNIFNPVQSAQDGLAAIAYLNGAGKYSDRKMYPYPEVMIFESIRNSALSLQ